MKRNFILRLIFEVSISLICLWLFVNLRINKQTQDSNLTDNPASLNQDQSAVTEFIKQNPKLADEFNDLIKVMSTASDQYVEERSRDELLKLAMKGIPSALDPNNVLYVDSEVEELKKSFGEQNYSGIGTRIEVINKFVFITNVFADSPAEKAGLRSGDNILKINGQDTWGMEQVKILNLIRGEDGTQVVLEIKSAISQQPFTVTLNRQKIVIPSVESSVFNKNIGYIKINSCEEETSRRFIMAVGGMVEAKGLIIDLRNNPGGLLGCAQSVLGYFVGFMHPVIIQKNRNQEATVITSTTKKPYPKKIVILINNYSASASEIIAGNLKYYKIATLVGVRTYGKQTVQAFFDINTGLPILNLFDFNSDLVLRLTIAHYFLPDGTNVSEHGVVPDVEVEQPDDFKSFEYKTARDLQFQKAIEILTAK